MLPSKLVTRQGGGPDVISEEIATEETDKSGRGPRGVSGRLGRASEAGSASTKSIGASGSLGVSNALGPGHGGSGMLRARAMARRNMRGK